MDGSAERRMDLGDIYVSVLNRLLGNCVWKLKTSMQSVNIWREFQREAGSERDTGVGRATI